MRRITAMGMLLAGLSAAAFGQARDQFRQASIRGGGGDGKCTIEVNVDDVAEIEITGDRARLVTLSGQAAQFRRFECNQRMPANPNEFRFTGVDGRGRQQLMRDPSGNRGIAVIRIEDPKGGREGYTFDITWRGGSDNLPGGRRDGDRRDGDRRDGDRRDGDRRGDSTFTVDCNSNDGYKHYCEVDTRNGVRLIKQKSGAECREGGTWGYDRRGIWVDRGCRADFEVRR